MTKIFSSTLKHNYTTTDGKEKVIDFEEVNKLQ